MGTDVNGVSLQHSCLLKRECVVVSERALQAEWEEEEDGVGSLVEERKTF